VWQTMSCPLAAPAAAVGVHTLRFTFSSAVLAPRTASSTCSGGASLAAPRLELAPPPASARVTVQSSLTGLYWGAPAQGSALVFANASLPAAAVFTVTDAEDGTYSLRASSSDGGGVLCVTGPGGSGPLAASAASAEAPCTRFWLYGTTAGQLAAPTGDEGAPSYALLSAASGQLLVASGADVAMGAAAGIVDPRNATGDGARFFIATLP